MRHRVQTSEKCWKTDRISLHNFNASLQNSPTKLRPRQNCKNTKTSTEHFSFNMPRKTFSNKEKVKILADVNNRMENGESLWSIATCYNLQAGQIRCWKKKSKEIAEARSSAKSVCGGRKSVLFDVEEDLLKWFFAMREQGLGISVKMMVVKAGELHASFRRATHRCKDQAMRRFLKAHNIGIRAHSHVSQRTPAEVREEALDFITVIRPILSTIHRSTDFILNMDQTPIFFTMTPRTTLNTIGERTN